jgi:exosortase
VLTTDAWRDIVHIAMKDEESSQILLVPLVVGWLWWVRRRRIRYCHPVGRMVGPVLVTVGWLLYSTGDWFLIELFWHGGAILVVVGCVLTIMGTDPLKNFAPVFLALVFLLPVPGRVRQRVAIPMQTATATVTQRVLELSGITVERSGNLLSIGGRDVTIGEACNGIRMMFALAMVSYVFAFTTPLRPYVRLIVIAASPLLAILCNVIRLVPTIWCYGNYPAWADRFHTMAGWGMLVIAFLMLMGIVSLLKWAILPVTQFTLAYD